MPLSAFIAEDMNEYVRAHATYRFVILDDEEERPRILVWLFKPAMRLAYAVPTQYVIPKSGAVRAAKVLFKILDTAAAYSDLDRCVSPPARSRLGDPERLTGARVAACSGATRAFPRRSTCATPGASAAGSPRSSRRATRRTRRTCA